MTIDSSRTVEESIRRGMSRQAAARREMLTNGSRHRGWKVAFTTPASRVAAGVDRSAVGYLTDATELGSGATVAIGAWTRPMIEAELALILGAPVPRGSELTAAAAAIAAVAVAIEVVDLAIPLNQVEAVLAGDIFHRHFVLGRPDPELAGGTIGAVRVEAWLDDTLAACEDHPITVIGEPAAVLVAVAAELEAEDLILGAGDIVMLGSAIPLTAVSPGHRLRVSATGLGELELSFTA